MVNNLCKVVYRSYLWLMIVNYHCHIDMSIIVNDCFLSIASKLSIVNDSLMLVDNDLNGKFLLAKTGTRPLGSEHCTTCQQRLMFNRVCFIVIGK